MRMPTSYYTAATTGADVVHGLSSTHERSNGVVPPTQEASTPPTKPAGRHQTALKKKYRHVAALHSKSQPSCLSHESEVAPSFLGFRNLMVLVLSEYCRKSIYPVPFC